MLCSAVLCRAMRRDVWFDVRPTMRGGAKCNGCNDNAYGAWCVCVCVGGGGGRMSMEKDIISLFLRVRDVV